MFEKGRLLCSAAPRDENKMLGNHLVVRGLVMLCCLVTAASGYGPTPDGPDGRVGTFDWFDTDAWSPGPVTWTSALDGSSVTINNLRYSADPNVHCTLRSATATCDIVLSSLYLGRYWWDHWGDLRVDDVNVTVVGSTFDADLNPLEWAREGNGWVTLKDMTLKVDSIRGGEKSVPPYQYDPCDPNNLSWDPTTWTIPWPAKCYDGADWGYNWLKLQGTTQVLHQEPGFFLWLGRGRSSDNWQLIPGGRPTDLFLDSTVVYKGVDANTAPNPDPNWGMGFGTSIRLFGKVELHYGMGPGAALCTMEMSALGELYPGVTIDLYPEGGYTNPAPDTNKVLMTVGSWSTNPSMNELPSLSASTDPNWTLTFQGPTLVATYQAPPTVVGRYVFHNNSWYDDSNAPEPSDDNAIDTSKTPLLPGNTATYANYVCNVDGVNGVMIDITAPQATPVIGDFSIAVSTLGDGSSSAHYTAVAAPSDFSVRPGEGVGGSDRVTLIFPNSDARNQDWMRITTSMTNIGLAADDVCYIGLAVGETGNNDGVDTYVNASDRLGARSNPHFGPTPVTDAYDVNRDSSVNASDRLIMRSHPATGFGCLKLITAP